MKPEITIIHGDNREEMKRFADGTFHAIVTDPPYELGFMGKAWDRSGIAYDPVVWSEALRVLKPGGFLLAFGGSRTYHRLACAIEDAGFEVRDMIEWIYGSGFPKSLDVSKAMDKFAGAVRPVIGKRTDRAGTPKNDIRGGRLVGGVRPLIDLSDITAPATAAAKQWEGYGTALKPAHEPICVARKPLIGTVVENVLKHGTGALNITAGRVDGMVNSNPLVRNTKGFQNESLIQGKITGASRVSSGRFPANLILDGVAAAMLDEQSGGNCGAAAPVRRGHNGKSQGIYADFEQNGNDGETFYADTGGASRFFYTAKASGTDRGNKVKGALPLFGVEEEEFRNTHPTVKPLALMTYLLKLVCPVLADGHHVQGGQCRVLDPFAGSGTTLVACQQMGIACTGIELLEDHVAICRERLNHKGTKEQSRA